MGLLGTDEKQQQIFLGLEGGNMELAIGAETIQVISSQAPLGKALLGKCEGDEVAMVVAQAQQQFEVLWVR